MVVSECWEVDMLGMVEVDAGKWMRWGWWRWMLESGRAGDGGGGRWKVDALGMVEVNVGKWTCWRWWRWMLKNGCAGDDRGGCWKVDVLGMALVVGVTRGMPGVGEY